MMLGAQQYYLYRLLIDMSIFISSDKLEHVKSEIGRISKKLDNLTTPEEESRGEGQC